MEGSSTPLHAGAGAGVGARVGAGVGADVGTSAIDAGAVDCAADCVGSTVTVVGVPSSAVVVVVGIALFVVAAAT